MLYFTGMIINDLDYLKEREAVIQKLTFQQFVSKMVGLGYKLKYNRSIYSQFPFKNKKGKFNLYAYMLSDQNPFTLTISQYEGKNKAVLLKYTSYKGSCLLNIMEQCYYYISMLDEIKIERFESGKRERPLFDKDIARQVMIQAFLHTRWFELLPPAISLFDDRLEIEFYCGIFGNSLAQVQNGNINPIDNFLESLVSLANLDKESDIGMQALINKYGKNSITFENGKVIARVPFAFETTLTRFRKARYEHLLLNDAQKSVLRYIYDNPQATAKEIAQNLSFSEIYVKKIFVYLKEIGYLERGGSKKKGFWKINNLS